MSLAAFPEAQDFVNSFGSSVRRRPIVLIVGATNLGKSELASQILLQVARVLGLGGYAEVTVETDGFLDCSAFDVTKHAGILLDGIGDILFLKTNRETLQGRPKVLFGGRSQTMRWAYPFTLTRRAVVATADLGAENLHLLSSDHWLSDGRNVCVLRLSVAAVAAPGAPLGDIPPEEQMRQWSVAEVVSFLKAKDLAGPAAVLFTHGVRGEDFLDMTSRDLTEDLRLSRFTTRRLLAVRAAFLRNVA